MKEYYGNYLGMVINSNDPEYRGRVQVFVPHIMPALYEGWNQEGKDIQISCVGSNIPDGLTPEIHERLVKILPWAEAASPIIGASAPGNLFSDIVSGVKSAVGHFFNQTPTSTPAIKPGCGGGDLAKSALSMVGTSTAGIQGTRGGNVGCAAAVSMMFKNATGQDIIPGREIVLGTSDLYSHMSKDSANWAEVPIDQMEPGDVLVTARGSRAGHTGIYAGDGRIVSNSSSGFQGSEGGTIQNNYSIDRWKSGVISRNPQGSGVFRYVGPVKTAQPNDPVCGDQSGAEVVADSSTPATPNPLANPQGATPESAPVPQSNIQPGGEGISGTVSGGGTIDTSNMSPAFKAQYEKVYASLEGSKFINTVPNDGETYGITTGSREEWAHFFTRNASVESSFNPNTAADINGLRQGKLTSFGIYQMGTDQFKRHGGGDVFNPNDATNAYLNYAEEMYFGNTYKSGGQNVIGGKKEGGGWYGLAAGYGPIRRITTGNPSTNEKQLLSENMSASEKQAGNYTGSVNPAATLPVHNTDGGGRTPVINTNDMANGLFAYPNPGAMVWVFFREGNPLYPVYFAASYSASEWSSAYRGGSPAEGMADEGGIKGTGTIMKLGPEGGIMSQNRTNIGDPSDSNSSLSLFHQHGSNITFKDGYDFFYTRNNKRDEVESDRFVVTKGYKEQWVEGDESSSVRGNMLIKIGKIDEEAVKAAQELSDFSYDLNQMLMEKK